MNYQEIAQVKDIMTKEVLTAAAQDSLETIAELFERYNYDGIPVIGSDRKLIGIITSYDMVVESSGVHLPTLMDLIEKLSVNKADKKDLDEHFRKLREIKAAQIMNKEPLTVLDTASIGVAAKLFAEHHRVNPLCVVDENGVLAGVLSRFDVIKFFNAQHFEHIIEEVAKRENLSESRLPENDEVKIFPNKPPHAAEKVLEDIMKEFLLVTKKRPKFWKFIALSMFIAGMITATAFIIRIVSQ